MKNISLIINAALGVAIIILFVLVLGLKKQSNTTQDSVNSELNTNLGIAFVDLDSILLNYKLSVELNEAITAKHNQMKSRLDKEASEFEKDAQVFQDKVQRGIYLTQARAEEDQQKLMVRQQELQKLEYDYSNQLAAEQQRMNARLFDSISMFVKTYNTPEKFQVIMGHATGGAMLYGSKQVDITADILKGLNSRYDAQK